VKVEPTDGDPYRVFAVSHAVVNQDKRGAALDLADPGARAAFLKTSYQDCPPPRSGGLDFLGPAPAQRFYPTADGWLAIAASTDDERAALFRALGHPEWQVLREAEITVNVERTGSQAFGALAGRVLRRRSPRCQRPVP
jgi:crotonobetainyl-CoA:carnitine CoA-transferase CaiB-like acyl-CoA transferase